MIVSDEIYPEILDKILDFLTKKDIELLFINADDMRNINKNERGIDKTTDVLSFPYAEIPSEFLAGSVVINIDLAKEMAKKLGHSFESEIALLFTHGVLHILGFDHENDNGEMREKESLIIEKFGLPKSLIIRSLES